MPSFLSKLSTRIVALAILALGLSIVLTMVLQNHMRQTIEERRDLDLHTITEITVSLLKDLEQGVVSGKYTVEEAQGIARERLSNIAYGDSGYIYAFDDDYVIQALPVAPEAVGTNRKDFLDVNGLPLYQALKKVAVEQGHGKQVYHFTKPNSDVMEAKIGYVQYFEPWGWIIGTGAYVSDIEAELTAIRNEALAILAITLLVLGAAAYVITLSVTRPMGRLNKRMHDMAQGDTETEIPFTNTQNELGDMARSLDVFRDALVRQRELEEQQKIRDAAQSDVVTTLSGHLSKLSRGDLSTKIEEAFPEGYEALRSDFNASVTNLSETMTEVVDAAGSIRNGAGEISQASDHLAKRTENQAATLEETAAALDDLTSSVKSAAEGARSVETTMAHAKAEAEQSEEVVRNAVKAMTEIEQSSSQISQIISVIDDIAFQTNLLALNAGVEAARAGDAGRGFAVVASEVRSLAHSSSEAAAEIKTLIEESSKHVDRGVDLVGQTGKALHSIVERVVNISGMVSDIAEGASQQSLGLGEINSGVTELDQVTQKNAAMVEEATAAGHMLNGDASRLMDLVHRFKIDATQSKRSEKRVAEPKNVDQKEKTDVVFKSTKSTWIEEDPQHVPTAVTFDDGNAAVDIWREF